MTLGALYPRFAEPRLYEALADTPVVLVHGPRQCGKTTLARIVGERRGYSYFSFDDPVALASATTDPVGFVADLPERAILDEVQRVPGLFLALKTAVDRRRVPGRFILTGSTSVLFVPKLADSLAGRMEILRLFPLAQCEIERAPPRFLERFFSGTFRTRSYERLGKQLADRVAKGSYPAALARTMPRRRMAWYRDYVETIVKRDVRDIARIRALDALPRLLTLAASQTARLLNVSDLASPFHLSRPTIAEYVGLLEQMFLLERLQPWHANRMSRLIKTPKLHLGDTGVACALLRLDAAALNADRTVFGRLLETFVFQELRRLASWLEDPVEFFHFRDKDGVEVDIVAERGTAVAGIEVKASSTVTTDDFAGLRKLKLVTGKRFAGGVVLYDGESSATFGDRLHAVPIRALWESR